MTVIMAGIRTPEEVIALVCPEKAASISAFLLRSLKTVPGTVIYVNDNGNLSWGHAEPDPQNKEDK